MELTKRQSEVAERLVQGMTIAAIADDLTLTESRVNQIIRALKNRFEVDTQAGIVAGYQRALQADAIQTNGTEAEHEIASASESLVPQILNTPHPVLYRLVAVSAVAFFIAGTLFLMTLFATMITEASNGRVVIGDTVHPVPADD